MTYVYAKKPGTFGELRMDPGDVVEVPEGLAARVRRFSKGIVVDSRERAELAADLDDALDYNDLQSLASDVREARGDAASILGGRERFHLLQYVAEVGDTDTLRGALNPGDTDGGEDE